MKIDLFNNNGFKWFIDSGIYVKGYIFDDNNILYKEYDFINFIKKNIDNINNIMNIVDGCFCIIINKKDSTILITDRLRSIPIFINNNNFDITDNVYEYIKNNNDIKFSINQDKINEFTTSGFISGEDTLIDTITQVEAGSISTIRNFNLNTFKYHKYKFCQVNGKKEDLDIIQILHKSHINVFDRLIKSLNNRRVVVPLSSGQDSRLIVYLLNLLGYKKVLCFSYGKLNNYESKKSKEIADYFGYDWYFVEYTDDKVKNIINSDEHKSYELYSSNLISLPHIQDFIAIKEMFNSKIISSDDIVVPGHSYDFLVGSHIEPYMLKKHIFNYKFIKNELFNKHNKLSILNSYLHKKCIIDSISKNIEDKNYNNIDALEIIERYNFNERQAKFIVNSVRVYEYFNLEWRIPLWDKELINFWSEVPIEYRFKRKLFFEYASSRSELRELGKHLDENIINNNLTNKYDIKNQIRKIPLVYDCLIYIKSAFSDDYYTHPLNWYKFISKKEYNKGKLLGYESINSFLVQKFINDVTSSMNNLITIDKYRK